MIRSGSMSYLYMGIVVPLCIIIPLSIGIYKYKSFPPALKVFVWYLILSGSTSVLTKFLARGNNLPILHVYTSLEFSIFAIFYKKAFKNAISGKLTGIFILSFVLSCVINALYFQSIYTYNSYTRSLEAIFVIAFAIAYFFRALEKPEVSIKDKEAILWINAALLIYFSGALVLFIVSNMVISNVSLGTKLWNINATLVLIMYILFATGLWKARK